MRAFPAPVEKYFESFWSGDVGGLDKLDQRGRIR